MGVLGRKARLDPGPRSLGPGGGRGYRVFMKSYAVAAALVLLPAFPAFAESGIAAAGFDASDRSKLLNEIEAWRATKLPHVTPPAPITERFEPRLDAIKAAALAASGPEDVAKPRKDFEAWKTEVLRGLYAGQKAEGLTRESFADFSGEQKTLAQFSAALHVELAEAATTRAIAQERMVAMRAFALDPSKFDGGIAHSGGADAPSSVVVAPPALAASDPARYSKVRQILISQGAKPRVVDLAIKEAIRQNADPLLVLAVIKQESGFNAHATSGVGARGLMQIMPDTGRGLGVRDSGLLYDAQTNLRAGIAFLKSLWGQFVGGSMSEIESMNPFSSHDVKAAVAAYNAGPGAVRKYSGVPPYRETQGYVKSVLAYYAEFKQYLDA